ncbi:sialic acid TRAP transporter substrate-binding protein SiaP [Paraglaciecola aquimarina]|uniref:Sialic acid TRAP transporter substrate-binding protein SiaP n=1 Tax=Paraglaciecola algarum TaxID=3050085 RepID=A0ABS9D1M5_9ALTE|nr:sialic acid TRAP transporter substrate-binding protein SiaP [Paraglaciecola sp. G1-23]MCF2946818.1 sialic acid TRAP transporter substrate-binding protein SiaP [Paraglaciecola sp. G1-23]
MNLTSTMSVIGYLVSRNSRFLVLFLTLWFGVSSFSVWAKQEVKHLTWAHVYETSEPLHKWAVWAAEEINKRTEGRYTIDVFPVSIMGKEAELNQSLSLGTIDIIYTGTSFAAQNYPPIALPDLPYVFRDYQHWQKFNDSDLFIELAEGYKLASRGNRIVGNNYYGQRHVTSNKPIKSPKDMLDLKLRVPNASIFKMFPLAVGANPSPIAFSEVYLALQQGVVDAQENPLPTIKAKKFYEVQEYISLTGHLQGAVISVASDRLWNMLSDTDKVIFSQVFKQAAAKVSADTRQSEKDLISWFEEQGVTVLTVDRSAFREKVLPTHVEAKQRLGADLYDRLQNIR